MMRLVCPNCDAEYEVEDTLIPPAGRDVQCSNCGVTWFQKAMNLESENDVPPAAAASGLTPQRPKTDPKALDIIHKEVERERRARQSESGAIETQGDLGLQGSAAQQKSFETDMEVSESEVAAAPRPAEPTKKELFPDIEEINSTLADAPDPAHEEDSEEANTVRASSRSGFRMGFGLMLMFTAALIALYVYAPEMVERFPGAEGLLRTYVSLVDTLRQALDFGAQGLLTIVTDLTERVGS